MWTEITRRKYEPEGQRYASDLTDAEWALIEPHMVPKYTLPMSKIAMVQFWSSRRSTSCFPGCATCLPTASTTAPICMMPSPSSATGPLRSSNARLTQLVFSCCHAAGLSSERSLGSIATAAWQRISRRQSRALRRGSISPQCNC
jgi:transposase